MSNEDNFRQDLEGKVILPCAEREQRLKSATLLYRTLIKFICKAADEDPRLELISQKLLLYKYDVGAGLYKIPGPEQINDFATVMLTGDILGKNAYGGQARVLLPSQNTRRDDDTDGDIIVPEAHLPFVFPLSCRINLR